MNQNERSFKIAEQQSKLRLMAVVILLGLMGSLPWARAGGGVIDCTGFPDGTSCDTRTNVCPIGTCQGGVCVATAGVPCADIDGNDCTEARCDGAGNCNQSGFLLTGPPCPDTDGNICTEARCVNGICDQNGNFTASGCNTGSSDCPEGTCVMGQCLAIPGFPCADTDANDCTEARCNSAGVCDQNGFFVGGIPCPDTDGNPCTEARCDFAGNCNQNGSFTGIECSTGSSDCPEGTCVMGQCLAIPGFPCTDTDGTVCTEARCNGAGVCDQNAVIIDGISCDTGSTDCPRGFCSSGICQADAEASCPDTDGNPCTLAMCRLSGVCDQNAGVIDGISCDTGSDDCPRGFCLSGICQADSEASCPDTDGNPCTLAMCRLSGVCDQNAGVIDGISCDTGSADCPSGTCDGGVCTANPGIPCADTDGNACTVAECNSSGTCDQHADCTDSTPPVITCPSGVSGECGRDTDPAATGEATATDDCDPNPDVGFSDVVTPSTDPTDPVQATIQRTWTTTDECTNSNQCVQTITVLKRTLNLDIKPGSCPNAIDIKSRGSTIPVALLGTADFDVRTVDLTSLRLSRADGVGGSIIPISTVFQDTSTPFNGNLCACTTRGADRIMDLSMRFNVTDAVRILRFDTVNPGSSVVLVLTGALTDGCRFLASDCIVRTPVKGR